MPYIPASSEEADTRPHPGAAQRPPGELLTQAAQLAVQAQLVVEKAVIAERMKGTSWEVIGEVLGGVSKSAAQKRWGAVVARWRDSTPIDRRKLPPYIREDLVEFAVAYPELDDAWHQATEIVVRQPLLTDLNNAAVALSGSPGVHTGTGSQQIYRPLPAACHCAQEPEVASRARVQAWEAALDQGAAAVEAFLSRDRLAADADPVRDAQDLDAVRARGSQAVNAILAEEKRVQDAFRRARADLPEDGRDNPENADRKLEPHAAPAASERRRYSTKNSRRREFERVRAELQRQELTLEERVTRLERAFEDLWTDALEGQ
ncbi:hypothetical protein [Streptomyces olivochromogenes]|uniref:hypothetical protein n=1 Tax=Streptomyces olivochromogenes TaxID=1963 RepID=UPI00367CEF92